jgi:hypothetical protein
MIDLLHLPKPTTGNADYFIGKSSTLGQSWETWEKPRGITMIRFICIGGGGSGGNGFASATTTARGGGGGGGSGGYSSVVLPAILIPDTVYISAGRGGIVGAGMGSYVTVIPYTGLTAIYTLCYANGGSAGGNGAAGAVGALGAAAPIATRANTLLSGYGELILYAGSQGSTGGAVAGGNSTAITYPVTGLLLSGGCGGGGGATGTGGTAGVAITTPGSLLFPSISAGTNGSPGGVGGTGIELYQPLLSTGGGGGGASNSATTAGGPGGNA